MSKGSLITLAVLIVLIFAGLIGWKQYQRASAEAAGREEAIGLVARNKGIIKERAYFDGLMARHHDEAFAASYQSGGLFAPSEFDSGVYIEKLFDLIVASAEADGKVDVVSGIPAVSMSR